MAIPVPGLTGPTGQGLRPLRRPGPDQHRRSVQLPVRSARSASARALPRRRSPRPAFWRMRPTPATALTRGSARRRPTATSSARPTKRCISRSSTLTWASHPFPTRSTTFRGPSSSITCCRRPTTCPASSTAPRSAHPGRQFRLPDEAADRHRRPGRLQQSHLCRRAAQRRQCQRRQALRASGRRVPRRAAPSLRGGYDHSRFVAGLGFGPRGFRLDLATRDQPAGAGRPRPDLRREISSIKKPLPRNEAGAFLPVICLLWLTSCFMPDSALRMSCKKRVRR